MSADVRGIVPTGAIRYNTDSNKMECFNGTKWMQIAVSSPDLGKATNSPESTGNARGVSGGGTSYSDVIEYLNIESTGNTTDFGDLYLAATAGANAGSVCNATRGFMVGGYDWPNSPYTSFNTIQYITTATLGNSLDWGDLVTARNGSAICSSPIRAVVAGGTGYNNTIEYFSIVTA